MGRNTFARGADCRLAVAIDVKFGIQHFRDGERGAKPLSEPPHAEIRDARHGREKRPALEG